MLAVASILKSVAIRLIKNLTHVTKSVLISDNAGCHHNCLLLVMAQLILAIMEIYLKTFLHAETQDVK